MNKKTQKTFFYIGGSIILVVVVALILFPGLFESIGALITGTVNYCYDAPFALNCICPEGTNKQQTSIPFKSFCESNELMFDPQSPTFESDALTYAKNYLRANFPNCDSIDCPEPAALLLDADITLTPEHRAVYFECRNPSGQDYWEILFSIETGNVEKVACTNISITPIPTETPAVINLISEWNRTDKYYYQATLGFSADCINDNGKATTTINVPISFTAESWDLLEGAYGIQEVNGRWKLYLIELRWGYCSIKSSDTATATVECNANCPKAPFTDHRFIVVAYYPLS